MDQFQQDFYEVYGQGNVQQRGKFRPSKIHLCKWDTNELFNGSYSFMPVGAFESTDGKLTKLNEPLEVGGVNRLYFAGEAHSQQYSGYLQGAYYSGEEVAK